MTSTVAIVTGAAGDIGRAISRRLAQDHDVVLMADIREAAVIDAAHGLGDAARFLACATDVTNPTSVAAMAATAAAQGTVRTLVNNAGATWGVSLHEISLEDWRLDNLLNLEAAFLCFRAVTANLREAKGAVVNIASVNALGVYGHPAYSAAHAGLLHLTRQIAVEYGPSGIRANAVAPGTVRTEAWRAGVEKSPDLLEEAARLCPLGRLVEPDDVAEAVGFLAGPHAGAITGVCLPVDAGLVAGQGNLARTFTRSDSYGAPRP